MFTFPAQASGSRPISSACTQRLDAEPGVVGVRVLAFSSVSLAGVADVVPAGIDEWLRLRSTVLAVTIVGGKPRPGRTPTTTTSWTSYPSALRPLAPADVPGAGRAGSPLRRAQPTRLWSAAPFRRKLGCAAGRAAAEHRGVTGRPLHRHRPRPDHPAPGGHGRHAAGVPGCGLESARTSAARSPGGGGTKARLRRWRRWAPSSPGRSWSCSRRVGSVSCWRRISTSCGQERVAR